MIKLSDYVCARLAAAGAKHVFLVPGGMAMHLNDSVGRSPDLEFVCNLHEHGSAVAAEAYAKVGPRLGVALVTAGPGATNCVTGLGSAWVNSAPVVFLSGQVKRADRRGATKLRQRGLQEIDVIPVVQSLTKYAATVDDPSTIREHLDRALYLAQSGRPGPVWLEIPLDVQAAQIEPDELPGWSPEPADEPALDAAIDEVLAALATAERPVLLAGGGIRMAGAVDAFRALVDALGVPVATTWVGIDLFADEHPLYVGRPGAFATRGANFAVQNADLLISIGARWDFATTGFSPQGFARGAKRIVVDVDPAETDKLREVADLVVTADARAFVEQLARRVAGRTIERREAWLERCHGWGRRYPVVTPEMRGRGDDTSTYVFVEQLGRMLAPGDVVVQGSAGVYSEIFCMSYPLQPGQRVICDGSNGAMGYGVPAALGACLAAGGRRTALVDGDGSFMPNVQELETIARLRVPVKIFVINNGGFQSIRVSQQRWFQRLVAADAGSGLSLPSIERVAAAFGIPYDRVACEADLEPVMARVLAAEGPSICEIRAPADEDRVPRLANYQRADGTMASKPLEDLFPFLPRDEFLENMIVPPLPE